MKFSQAWASIASQNFTLRWVVLTLSVLCAVLAILAVKMALRAPIVIERACYTKAAQVAGAQRTPAEIEKFVRAAIETRFNSTSFGTLSYLTFEEQKLREREQDELKRRTILQTVVVNQIKVEGSNISIDSDRVIGVGAIRSAFSFQLKATLLETDRTEANPYGLILSKVTVLEKKEEASK